MMGQLKRWSCRIVVIREMMLSASVSLARTSARLMLAISTTCQ
jgi:hypothetical protein